MALHGGLQFGPTACGLEKFAHAINIHVVYRGKMKLMATKREGGTLLEPVATRVKPPPLYKVLLLNDDYTPMEFVVHVLQKFFGIDRERATQIMLKVHTEGVGVCGVFPKDIALTKVEQVVDFARQHQHPLQCTMEEN